MKLAYNDTHINRDGVIMWNKIKHGMYRFMYGRYGSDTLNTFVMFTALILAALNMIILDNGIVHIFVLLLLFWNIFRSYSKNIYIRRSENAKFLALVSPMRKRINLAKKKSSDKEHRYFVCPSCKQNVRVPKGRGKIVITCPKCKNQFERKS